MEYCTLQQLLERGEFLLSTIHSTHRTEGIFDIVTCPLKLGMKSSNVLPTRYCWWQSSANMFLKPVHCKGWFIGWYVNVLTHSLQGFLYFHFQVWIVWWLSVRGWESCHMSSSVSPLMEGIDVFWGRRWWSTSLMSYYRPSTHNTLMPAMFSLIVVKGWAASPLLRLRVKDVGNFRFIHL